MILLFGAVLLVWPTEAFINSLRFHYVDSLKLACEALPYRTVFEGNRCYFVVFEKVIYNDAPSQCTRILKDAKVALNVPESVLEKTKVESSSFHIESTSEAKHTICFYGSKSCKKLGMDLFSPDNDFENSITSRELVKNSAWAQKSLGNRGSKFAWNLGKSYARFTTCDEKSKKSQMNSGTQTKCNAQVGAVLDKSGYWSTTDQKNEMDTICTRNVVNEYTPVFVKKPVFADKEETCVQQHELDDATGKCEWTGPADACVQLIDYWNNTYFVNMERFPEVVFTEECLLTTQNEIDDYTVKVVVRRGCMFTGYAWHVSGNAYENVKIGENLVYGAHRLPNYMTREFAIYWDGLSRVHCFCDPTEATVSGHVPVPPPDQKCIDYHEFNETTQQCEWTLEPKFCAEIRTNDNRRMLLEIPKWPENKKYDVNHYLTRGAENFHITVTNIVVRQHCFATLWWDRGSFHPWKTMPTMGYGHHVVASKDNNLATAGFGGTGRFTCECIR